MIFVIAIVTMLVSLFVQWRLKSKFREYSQIPLAKGMSGAEVAEYMLRDNGIHNVRVMSVEGQLTDHYNPMDKTVNLSPDVYHGRNASAVAGSRPRMRPRRAARPGVRPLNAAQPVGARTSRQRQHLNMVLMVAIFGGAFLYRSFPMNTVLLVIIACHAVITLVSLITLPVEFDASRRAWPGSTAGASSPVANTSWRKTPSSGPPLLT
jgi:Zn-dependent membrane protease YugP